MGFLQEFWHIMKKYIVDLFQELHKAGSFVKSLNTTFLVLIAKFGGACNIKDFILISLVVCIYKIIAKVLTKRLARVIDMVVGECQHAYVDGRQILDAAIIANEVVDELIYRERKGVLSKLYIEKAYDHVN